MNPVNATALYVSASRLVLNYDPGDPQSFTEINKLLPYFRQSLSCCVCGEDLSFVPRTMSRPPPPPGLSARRRGAALGPRPRRPEETPSWGSSRPGSRTRGAEAAQETFPSLWPRSLSPPGGRRRRSPRGRARISRGGRRAEGCGGGTATRVPATRLWKLGKVGVFCGLNPPPARAENNPKWRGGGGGGGSVRAILVRKIGRREGSGYRIACKENNSVVVERACFPQTAALYFVKSMAVTSGYWNTLVRWS